jgi:4-hydroxyphenylacetate 3-monooxygenase
LKISEKTVLVDSFAALSLLAAPLLARSGTIEMSRAVLLETTETGLMMHRRLGIALGTMGEDAAVARLSSNLVSRNPMESMKIMESIVSQPAHTAGVMPDAPPTIRAGAAGKVGACTGAQYLQSLNDGREVWINGQRVKDVANHPAFRNSARMIARLYDSLHDPKKAELLTIPIDNGSGMRTHRFFQAPRSIPEQVAARDAIVEWARMTYGWMGRTPDYKAAWFGTLGLHKNVYQDYQANADRWYDIVRERVPYFGHAIVHPPVDRQLPNEQSDVFVRVDEETDGGIVVSGAKVVATGAPLTQYIYVGFYGNVIHKEKRFSPVFIVPPNAPGVKLICRSSYEFNSGVTGRPFDAPLSGRFDENDTILILDKVFVPWEDVLMYGVENSNRFAAQVGHDGRNLMHGCARLAVKMDFFCGMLLKAVEITGTKDFRGVQASVGEAIALRHLIWSLSDAMVHSGERWCGQYFKPNYEACLAYRNLAADAYSRMRNLISKTVASGLIYLPSSGADFEQPELKPYLDKYVRGSNGIEAIDRVKLLKLLWDSVGSEFASRHELYEINYAGNYEQGQLDAFKDAHDSGLSSRMKSFVEQCMDEYDHKGWTVPDLVNPSDINLFWPKGRD